MTNSDGPNADRILELLSDPATVDRRTVLNEITAKATILAVVEALEKATIPKIKSMLCDALGEREDSSAIAVLMHALNDRAPTVRASAADALAKVGNTAIGPALLNFFKKEIDDGVCQMLAIALGAVGYRMAAPTLMRALVAESGMLRGSAAWSLGKLGVVEAAPSLEKALSVETNKYAIARMKQALEQIMQ